MCRDGHDHDGGRYTVLRIARIAAYLCQQTNAFDCVRRRGSVRALGYGCEGQQMTDQLKAFIAGGAGGAACVSVGFPFDTIKVKMQTAEALLHMHGMSVLTAARPTRWLPAKQTPNT